MDPEVVGMSARQNTEKDIKCNLKKERKKQQRLKSDFLYNDIKTQLAKTSGDYLTQGKPRDSINWVSYLKQNC